MPGHERAPEESAERTTTATSTGPREGPLTIAPRQSFAEANCANRKARRKKTKPSRQWLDQVLLRVSETTSRDISAIGRPIRQEMKTSGLFHEMNRLATDTRQTAAIKPLYSEPPSARLLLVIHRLPTTTTKNSPLILTNADQRSTEDNSRKAGNVSFSPIPLARAVWPTQKYLRASSCRQPIHDPQQCLEVNVS